MEIGTSVPFPSRPKNSKIDLIQSKDVNGDTCLHAAALNGNTQCIMMLLYFIRSSPNKQGFLPKTIALNSTNTSCAGVQDDVIISTIANGRSSPRGVSKTRNAKLIQFIEDQFIQVSANINSYAAVSYPYAVAYHVYGCTFEQLNYVIYTYKSRWCKCYDPASDSYYYYDQCFVVNNTLASSQWERPLMYDESETNENKYECACEILKLFYSKFNSSKISDINNILTVYRHNYTDLFMLLAQKYNTDLNMFRGIGFD